MKIIPLGLFVLSSLHFASISSAQPLDDLSIEQIALMTKQSAVEKLERLLEERKLEKNRKGEGLLWVRLAEEKQQIAAIEYKIAQDKAERTGKSVTDEHYRQQIAATLPFLNQAILRDPSSQGTARAYFLRGKAYREMGKNSEAIQDFQKYIALYPKAPERALVSFALADLNYSATNYAAAIRFLSEVKLTTNFKHYAEALNVLAWSHYRLGKIEKAIDYSRNEVQFYQGRVKKGAKSYMGGLQRAAIDYAQFYVTAIDKKIAGYSIENAYQEFSQLVDDRIFQEVALQFVKSLKIKMWHEPLDLFKEVAIRTQPGKGSTFEILLVVLDHQILYQRVESFERSLSQSAAFLESFSGESQEAYRGRVVQVLSNSVDTFTQYVQKNSGHELESRFRHGLNQIYVTLLRLLPESDPRVAILHFNMGENAFVSRDYSGAAKQFRLAMNSADLRKAAALKSVSARYEQLRLTAEWPRKIELRSSESTTSPEFSEPMQEWLAWVDDGISTGERARPWDTFAYEAARIRYLSGSVDSGVDFLKKFVSTFPGSSHSAAAQTLVLDTYVHQKNWDAVKSTTAQFKELQKGASPVAEDQQLTQRFRQIENDAQFKDVEKAFDSGESSMVFQQADQAVGNSGAQVFAQRRWDIVALGLAAAVKTNDSDRSLKYSTALTAAPRDHASREQALRVRADLLDRKLDIPAAVDAYGTILAEGNGSDEVRKRMMELSWISGDPAVLRKTLLNPKVCPDSEEKTCDQYRAVLRLVDPEQRKNPEVHQYALLKVKRKLNRWLWAAVAWNGIQKLSVEDQNLVEKTLSENFEDVDLRIRLSLVHWIEPGFANRIAEIQRRAIAPAALEKRIQTLENLDQSFSKMSSFQWAPTRLDLQMSMFEIYESSASEVGRVQPPAAASPEESREFAQVVAQIQEKFKSEASRWKERIQSTVSDSGINFDRSVRLAKNVSHMDAHPDFLGLRSGLSLSSLRNQTLDTDSQRWVGIASSALEKENFPLAFESIQRFSAMSGQDESRVHFAKAVLFERVGAIADAMNELKQVQSKDRLGVESITEILKKSLCTYDRDAVKKTIDSGKDWTSSPAKSYFTANEVKIWEYAAQFSGTTLPQRMPGSIRVRRNK